MPTASATLANTTMADDGLMDITGYYYTTRWKFYALHASAMGMIALSISGSLILIVYIIKKYWGKFWTQANMGDRLALYLSIADFGGGVHIIDHILLTADPHHISMPACTTIASLLVIFGLSQGMVVAATAVNCMARVVFQKKPNYGRYDWRLHALAYVPSLATCAVLLSLGALGPSGVWCLIDSRRPGTARWNALLAGMQGLVLLLIVVCYSLVWRAIHSSAYAHQRDYKRTRSRMITFVLAYVIRFTPYFVYTAWVVFTRPHDLMHFFTMMSVNAGGILNSIAYFAFRKGLNKQVAPLPPSPPPQYGLHRTPTKPSLARSSTCRL